MASNIQDLTTTPNPQSFIQKVEAAWNKHQVAILVGIAVAVSGVAIALTGGLAAIPAAAAVALIASGTFTATGGGLATAWHLLKDRKVEVAEIEMTSYSTTNDGTPPRSPLILSPDDSEIRIPHTQLPDSDDKAAPAAPSSSAPTPEAKPVTETSALRASIPLPTGRLVQEWDLTKNQDGEAFNFTSDTTPAQSGSVTPPHSPFQEEVQNEDLFVGESSNSHVSAPATPLPQASTPTKASSPLLSTSQDVSEFDDPFVGMGTPTSQSSLRHSQFTPQSAHETTEPTPPKAGALPRSPFQEESKNEDSFEQPKEMLVDSAETQAAPSQESVVEYFGPPRCAVSPETQPAASYLPSARKVAACLAGGAALATLGYGAYVLANLSPQERDAYLKSLASSLNEPLGAIEDLFRKGEAAVVKAVSPLNYFSSADNVTRMEVGTSTSPFIDLPTNHCAAPSPDFRRSYMEFYGPRLGALLTQTTSAIGSFLWSTAVYAGGFVPSREDVVKNAADMNLQVKLPSKEVALAVGATVGVIGLGNYSLTAVETAPAQKEKKSKPVTVVELKNDDIPDDLLLLPSDSESPQEKPAQTPSMINSFIPSARKTRALVGIGLTGAMIALGCYRFATMSEEEQTAFLNWINSTSDSWGNSLEGLVQKAVNADPVGALTNLATQSTVSQTVGSFAENVQTCASAAAEYAVGGDVGTIQTLAEAMEACPFTASMPQPSFEELGIPFVDLTKVVEPRFTEIASPLPKPFSNSTI